MHVVLLGDSILDNSAHGSEQQDVASLLKDLLGTGARVTLVAREGDVTVGIPHQVRTLPGDATHLVLSVGGNGALGFMELLRRPVPHVWGALEELTDAVEQFRAQYHAALAAVLELGLPTLVFTIYNGAFPEEEQAVITTALRLFNDVIVQAAGGAGLPVAELRRVCREGTDFLNPIEPSPAGRWKLAHTVRQWIHPPVLYRDGAFS